MHPPEEQRGCLVAECNAKWEILGAGAASGNATVHCKQLCLPPALCLWTIRKQMSLYVVEEGPGGFFLLSH